MKRPLALPNPASIARRLRDIMTQLPEPGAGWVEPESDDDDNDGGTDVRLQVYPSGEWAVRWGDSSYDSDHRGYWGSGYLTREDGNCEELALALVNDAAENAAQSDRECIDYGAPGWEDANDNPAPEDWSPDDDDGAEDAAHVHTFGEWERSTFGGTLHRKCTYPGCNYVSLDGDDDDDDGNDPDSDPGPMASL